MSQQYYDGLNIGDIRYVGGHKLKIKIVLKSQCKYPVCEIIGVGNNSKYEIGDVQKFHRHLLKKNIHRRALKKE